MKPQTEAIIATAKPIAAAVAGAAVVLTLTHFFGVALAGILTLTTVSGWLLYHIYLDNLSRIELHRRLRDRDLQNRLSQSDQTQ